MWDYDDKKYSFELMSFCLYSLFAKLIVICDRVYDSVIICVDSLILCRSTRRNKILILLTLQKVVFWG